MDLTVDSYGFVIPRVTNAAMLMAIGLVAVAVMHPAKTPAWGLPIDLGTRKNVLAVKVSPSVGFVPLTANVEVRQDTEAVVDREVCLVAQGPAPSMSCWQEYRPAALVIRRLRLDEAGQYDVFAQVGTVQSNHVTVQVVSGQ